ncbi:unnamed protein product, partial [Rotaria magnacalcarata]
VTTKNINQTINVLNRQELHSFDYENENTQVKFTASHTKKNQNNRTTLINDDSNNSFAWYSVSITSISTAHIYVPNLRLGRISKYDNINSHIVSVDIKHRKPIQQSNFFSTLVATDTAIPVLITMKYLKYDNISGNQCVYLDTTNSFIHGQYKATLSRQWHWQISSNVCDITPSSLANKATCTCLISNG